MNKEPRCAKSTEALYQQALEHQRARRWQEARRLWTEILQQEEFRDRAQAWLDAYKRFDDKIALAYYYMWYTPERFNVRPGSRKTSMADIHPVIGPYDSSDPAVIEAHVKMARQARLDAFAVSFWWNRPEQRGILSEVVRIAGQHDLRICIDLEANEQPLQVMQDALRYYLGTYADNPHMLRKDGRLVVLVWGSWCHPPAEWRAMFDALCSDGLDGYYIPSEQQDPSYLGALRGLEVYTLVDIPDENLAATYAKLAMLVREYNQTDEGGRSPAQWSATVMPGFDERGIAGSEYGPGGAGWKDRRGGEYYRMTFEAALASEPDWLHVTSFNELPEHSHIEPMEEFGDLYLNLTAEFVDIFKATAFRDCDV